MLIKVQENSHDYLGIHTPIPSQGHGLKSLSFTTTKKALLIYPDRIDEWTADKIIEKDGTFLLVGPWIDAEEVLPWSPRSQSQKFTYLHILARSFATLFSYPNYHSPFGAFAFFFLKNDGLMVLPLSWSRTIMQNLSDQEQLRFSHLIEPPVPASGKEASFEVAFGYLVGVLAYETITGEFPYSLSNTNLEVSHLMDLSQRKRAGLRKPLELFPVAVPIQLRETVEQLLKNPTKKLITDFAGLEVSADTLTPLKEAPGGKRIENRWKFASFWFETREKIRKNRGPIVAVAAVTILLVSLGTTILTRFLSPPPSLGWEPEVVVQEFYGAATNLDAELMDRLVVDGAASGFRQMVVQLFATARVRQAYEMRDPVLTPEEWKAQGSDSLEDSMIVFGIDELRILEVNSVGENLEVRVRYTLYTPDFPDEEPTETVSGPGVEVVEVEETLTLRRYRDAWVIAAIR